VIIVDGKYVYVVVKLKFFLYEQKNVEKDKQLKYEQFFFVLE